MEVLGTSRTAARSYFLILKIYELKMKPLYVEAWMAEHRPRLLAPVARPRINR